MLQIHENWQFASVIDEIASAEEENAAAATAAEEEEDLQRTNLKRRMEAVASHLEIRTEAAAEAAKITKRGMKEAVEESEVKAAASKSTADKATNFLLFLVGVCTDMCTMF